MARTSPVSTVVCDAGPLIHLDELGCLDLLSDFAHVLIPDVVWQEVAYHRPNALQSLSASLTRVTVSLSEEVGFLALAQALALHLGEQAALALMLQHPEALLLTDDAAARLAAEQLGRRAHGTLGVLLRAIRRGQRTPSQGLTLLRAVPQQSTLHIRPDVLNAIIAQVQHELGLEI